MVKQRHNESDKQEKTPVEESEEGSRYGRVQES